MSWSYSKLIDFEQCKFRYKLKHVDRVPEEKSTAADRGTAIHQMAEDFVNHKTKSLPTELLKFDEEFLAMRDRYSNGLVSLEGEWAFDSSWEPAPYNGAWIKISDKPILSDYPKFSTLPKYGKNNDLIVCNQSLYRWESAWLRMKADAVVFNKKHTEAIVIDYKTGKKFGNEIKHGEQTQLYSLATAIRNPGVERIVAELWYIDKDELTPVTYTREQAISFVKGFDKRAKRIDHAHETGIFEPSPNQISCQWCPYGPQKGNQCPHGYTGSMSIADYRRKFL